MKTFNAEPVRLYQLERFIGTEKNLERQGVTVPLALDCVSSR